MKKSNMYEDIYSSDIKRNEKYVDIYSNERKKSHVKTRVSAAKIFSILFFLILGLIGGFMIYCYNTLHSINFDNSIIQDDVDADDSAFSDKNVLNILLVGSDTLKSGENGRSDSLLILSLNLKTKKIKITSLMRDLWVNIPGHGPNRLNAAFSFGGAQLTIDTVQMNFGILIDRYAAVDFAGFIKIVDTLGGIDLEITATEASFINKHANKKNNPLKGGGLTHLNGDQTLQYSRNRDSAGSDYDRTQRQRTVIMTIFKQLKNANISQVTQSVTTLLPSITTSFKSSEILKLGQSAMKYLNFQVEDFRLPTNDNVRNETYNGMMVLVINNLSKARADLYNFIYEPEDKVIPEKIVKPPEKVHVINTKVTNTSNTQKSTPQSSEKVQAQAKKQEESTLKKTENINKSDNNKTNFKKQDTETEKIPIEESDDINDDEEYDD